MSGCVYVALLYYVHGCKYLGFACLYRDVLVRAMQKQLPRAKNLTVRPEHMRSLASLPPRYTVHPWT